MKCGIFMVVELSNAESFESMSVITLNNFTGLAKFHHEALA